MARLCLACQSHARNSIDAMLAERRPLREISGKFHISKSSLDRHRAHVAGDLDAAAQAGAVQRGGALAQQLADLVADAKRVQSEALQAKDGRLSLLAVRELVRIAELTARISGELQNRTHVTVEVQSTPSESEALQWATEALLLLASPQQQREVAQQLLARAGENQDQLLIEGNAGDCQSRAPEEPQLSPLKSDDCGQP